MGLDSASPTPGNGARAIRETGYRGARDFGRSGHIAVPLRVYDAMVTCFADPQSEVEQFGGSFARV